MGAAEILLLNQVARQSRNRGRVGAPAIRRKALMYVPMTNPVTLARDTTIRRRPVVSTETKYYVGARFIAAMVVLVAVAVASAIASAFILFGN